MKNPRSVREQVVGVARVELRVVGRDPHAATGQVVLRAGHEGLPVDRVQVPAGVVDHDARVEVRRVSLRLAHRVHRGRRIADTAGEPGVQVRHAGSVHEDSRDRQAVALVGARDGDDRDEHVDGQPPRVLLGVGGRRRRIGVDVQVPVDARDTDTAGVDRRPGRVRRVDALPVVEQQAECADAVSDAPVALGGAVRRHRELDRDVVRLEDVREAQLRGAVEELPRQTEDLHRVREEVAAPSEEVPGLARQDVDDRRLQLQVHVPDAEGRIREERRLGEWRAGRVAGGGLVAEEVHLHDRRSLEVLALRSLQLDPEARVAMENVRRGWLPA